MSREYDIYLQHHLDGVLKGFQWINEYCPELIPDGQYGEIFKTVISQERRTFFRSCE